MAATATKAEDIAGALRAARKRDLVKFLEGDPRVREWLGGALLGTRDAAEYIGVERVRLWRWVNGGRISPVAITKATPLFLKCDLDELKRDRARERSGE